METPEMAEPSKDHPKTTHRRRILAILLVPVLALTGLWAWRYLSIPFRQVQYAAADATFSGASESLKQTVIVSTLDSPLPPGRNVIWCSSFQLAWDEIRDKVIGAPLEVAGAEETATRLNTAKQSLSDLDAKSVYAAGGRIRDGIIERIQKDMSARFPSRAPDFSDCIYPDEGILAYSYVKASVPFKYPFRQVDEGLAFTDSQGLQTRVAGFGLWKAYLRPYENLRRQVEILYTHRNEGSAEELSEYALDLCRYSTPYQVVVARVEPKGSLAETLEYLRARMADFRRLPYYQEEAGFGANDELRIPEMFWRIDHEFKELMHKIVANANPPMMIVEALQTIEFRLDRSGAILESESRLAVMAAPRHFEFNRPFLVYLQKRDAEHPFFVMWVDNAELLTPR